MPLRRYVRRRISVQGSQRGCGEGFGGARSSAGFPTQKPCSSPGVSGLPRGAPKPAIGKRRARKLKLAVAAAEAIDGPRPASKAIAGIPSRCDARRARARSARMAAAAALARFESRRCPHRRVAVTQPGAPRRLTHRRFKIDERPACAAFPRHRPKRCGEQADGQAAVTIARRTSTGAGLGSTGRGATSTPTPVRRDRGPPDDQRRGDAHAIEIARGQRPNARAADRSQQDGWRVAGRFRPIRKTVVKTGHRTHGFLRLAANR